jgi:predicted nucleic acid-binding protein
MRRPTASVAPRDWSALPRLGTTVPPGPVLLDTNVFINALAGRGPPILRELMEFLPRVFVAAPVRAELAWVRGRLDPDHPGTASVLAIYEGLLSRIDPAKVLIPADADWLLAGELAGRTARVVAGGGGRLATAFDRVELISDALTAILAGQAGFTVVTEDRDFDVLSQLVPGLHVLFYDRRESSGGGDR